jgi:hypothetical protein
MWWPRKPEPVINWRLVKFISFCVDCDAEVMSHVPMLVVLCLECAKARSFVDSLPCSVQDRILGGIEQDLEA